VEKYNQELSKIDNLEIIQISKDRHLAKAVKWAKQESLPWPTILMSDISKTIIANIQQHAVPTYVLVDKKGKEIIRAHKSDIIISTYQKLSNES